MNDNEQSFITFFGRGRYSPSYLVAKFCVKYKNGGRSKK